MAVARIKPEAGRWHLHLGGTDREYVDLDATVTSSGVHYESACRQFDTLGFVTHTYDKVGSASGSPEILKWAVVYTTDARGVVMVVASAMAAFALASLLRPASQ